MAIANNKDLTHVVRTTQQWESSYDKYECIPEGVLCIEFTTSGQALAKIGNGRDIFSKLPYIGGAELTNYYTKQETVQCVQDILKAQKVIRIKGILTDKNQLPSNADCGDLYFVISQNQSSSNKYDEYVYSPSNTWENLGSIPIDIDLSEYAKIVYVDEKIDEVNERIDDIEQHGTHTHANKDILDLITAAFTAEEKDKLSTLYNYDDTELRELITQASHTHSNKDILDAISAPFTKEDKSKLDQLTPYDDSILKEKITALERLAHEHSNKRILDRTTASFTTEYERKMRWIRLYTGCTGMEEGIAGLVPAAQAGEEDYVLSGSGEWVPQTGGGGTYELPVASTSVLGGIKVGDGLEIDANGKLSVVGGGGGGDTVTEGGGISITTDPQTGVKTISVNTGDHLEVDENTGELNVTGVDYTAGKGIFIGNEYQNVEYIKNSGNYDQIILTDIVPNFSDKLEMDIKFGAATGNTTNDGFIGCTGVVDNNKIFHYGVWCYCTNSDSNIGFYNHFVWTQYNTGSNFITRPAGISYDGSSAQRLILTMQGTTASWGNTSINFSNEYMTEYDSKTFVDPQIGIAIFGYVGINRKTYFDCQNLTIYGVKLYDSNDTLLHNLIPVKKLSNNEGGLYDTVTNKFYGNSGNGSFVTGPAVETDDRIINAKIGDGLQFDSNNAIEVVTGNGLQINQDGELEIDPSIIPDSYEAGNAISIEETTDPTSFRVVNQEYFFDTHGLTCGLNARIWTTVNDGDILAAMCIHNNGGNQVPLFVGLTEDSVKVSQNYDSNILGPNGSFDYHGKTWYFTADYALSGTDGQDTQNHIQTLPTTYSFSSTPSNFEPAAKDLIDLAILLSDLEHPVISVKYKEGLKLNQYGELAVNVGDGLYIDTSAIDPAEFTVQNQEYFFNTTNVTATIDGTYGPRSFIKLYADDCLFALCNQNNYNTPILVGLTADSVKVRVDGSYGTASYGPNITFDYRGKTWYCTSGYGLSGGTMIDQTGTVQVLPTEYSVSVEADYEIIGKDLIDTAILLPSPNVTTVNAKLGNGLSFDANGAIQADAQPLSPATDSALGGVIVGEGINVNEYGEISLSAGEGLDIDFDSPLPSEYTLVKGISSTVNGNQYINTGYKINSATVIKMKCVLYKRNSTVWSIPLGTRNTNNSADGGLLFVTCWQDSGYVDTPSIWIERDSGTASSSEKDLFYNDIIELTFTNNSVTCYNTRTEDTIVLTSSSSVSYQVSYDLFIFATNDVGTAHFFGIMDLYRLQIFEGPTKLYDYIPCQRNSDSKYGLYDIINDEFKLSPNNAAFSYVQGTPTALDLIQQIKLLPATENTIGGVKPGDGILVDNDGTISVDPTIIPEVTEYEAGTAISIEDVEHGGVTFDAWDSGTGWENVCYSNPTGNSVVSYQYEAHSPISNSYTLPVGATHIRAIAYDQNDAMLWTSFSWIDSNDYHFASTSPEDGYYDDWFDIPTGAIKVNFGVRHSKLNTTTAMSLNDIKSVDITVQTVSEIEVDVWTGVTGWTNGDYYDGTSDQFTTSWPYTYHYNPSEYIPVPEGALKIRVIGISNENDSHFEGGGANIFDSNHHHIGWLPCCTVTDEWVDIPEGTVYVQPEVKWNNNNTRTISAADIKSVTLAWKLPALEINQAINVKYGDGLTVNQNNELEVNLGSGLQFDANGAIEVTGGSGGDTVAEGNGISITTDQQTGEKVISVDIGSGLAFDPQTGAINVTGGGDTVAEGDGISITTDQQTGDKVIAINPGAGLQVNQTTNELEVSSGVVTSIAPTQNTPGSITVTEGDGTTTPVSVISQMGGATSSTAGTAGYVPAPAAGDDDAYLRGDGTWDDSVLTEDDELTLVFVPDDYQPS